MNLQLYSAENPFLQSALFAAENSMMDVPDHHSFSYTVLGCYNPIKIAAASYCINNTTYKDGASL